MTSPELITAVTVEGACRVALAAGWDRQPVLYWVLQEPGKVTLQPTDLIHTAARHMTEAGATPNGLAPILQGIAWTGRRWGVSAVAAPDLVGVALFLTGWEVRYDPDNPAEEDQVKSWARDKRLKEHPGRRRTRQVHAAVRGQKMLSIHQSDGEEPALVEMTLAVPDALRACAAAFVPEWWEPRG